MHRHARHGSIFALIKNKQPLLLVCMSFITPIKMLKILIFIIKNSIIYMDWKSMPMLMYTVLSETYTCCNGQGSTKTTQYVSTLPTKDGTVFKYNYDGLGNITTVKENDVLKLIHTH